MRSTFACLTTIALLLGACGDDGDPSTTTNADTDATDSTTASTTDSTTASTTDSTTASTSASTTDSTTDSTTASTTASTTDESSTDPTDATETGTDPDTGTETGVSECPPEKGDDECSTCTKEMCCPELMACEANADCDCVVQCISKNGIGAQQMCQDDCGVEEVPAEATALQTCVATNGCLQFCL